MISEKTKNEIYDYLIEYGCLRGRDIFKPTKSRHGSCCCCQECGHYHDECICLHNEALEAINKIFND